MAAAGSLAGNDAATSCLALIGRVPLRGVEGRLDHLAYDPANQRLFVAALEQHAVEVIDLQRRQRVHEITGLLEPQGLAFIPSCSRLLVATRGEGTCRSFDGKTFAEGPWVDLGRNADNIRFELRAQTVFVGSGAEPGPGQLAAIDLASLLPASQGGKPAPPISRADLLLDRPRQGEVAAALELPAHPEAFQLEAQTHRMYVNVPEEHRIVVVDIRTNGLSWVANWPVTNAEKNFPMALDSERSRLFIACRKPACVLAYDMRTGAKVAQAPCVGDADDLFFDRGSKRLLVIGGEGFVDVFQLSSASAQLIRRARFPTVARARTGLFIPELQLLAVAAPHTANGPASVLLFQLRN